MNVLLITYYWPPSNSIAVQRWFTMAQYLAKSGVNMHVIIPEQPEYGNAETYNFSVCDNIRVIKMPIFEVRNIFRKVSNNNATDAFFFKKKKSFKDKLMLWIRANLFIPDARLPWVYQIRKKVNKYIQEHKIDCLITNGTPHSVHLIGLYCKNKIPDLKWLADFRDPWRTIEYYSTLPLTKWADNKHKTLEFNVLKKADFVTTVSPSWAEEMSKISNRPVHTVYNGFFSPELNFSPEKRPADKKIIAHIGTLNEDRNPIQLWSFLKENNAQYEVHLYGNISPSLKSELMQFPFIKFFGLVNRKKALQAMHNCDILLLSINQGKENSKGRIPAKVFEYIKTGNDILFIGNLKGDALNVLLSAPSKIFTLQKNKLTQMENVSNKKTDINFYSRASQAHIVQQLLNKSLD